MPILNRSCQNKQTNKQNNSRFSKGKNENSKDFVLSEVEETTSIGETFRS